MKTIFLALMLVSLLSCNSNPSREEAIEYMDSIIEIGDECYVPCQAFVDYLTNILIELDKDNTYQIDFNTTYSHLASALAALDLSISKLEKIEEIDNEMNYKTAYELYLKSERESFNAAKNWLDYIKENGTIHTDIEMQLYDTFYKKLQTTKEKEIIQNEKGISFNKKYGL
jgi:hypothetical protein